MTHRTPIDPFAHLRDNLATYRAHTTFAQEVPWCAGCEVHQAPAPGELCPVCAEELSAA
jgi:predicted amidophosphoribosyltransferase